MKWHLWYYRLLPSCFPLTRLLVRSCRNGPNRPRRKTNCTAARADSGQKPLGITRKWPRPGNTAGLSPQRRGCAYPTSQLLHQGRGLKDAEVEVESLCDANAGLVRSASSAGWGSWEMASAQKDSIGAPPTRVSDFRRIRGRKELENPASGGPPPFIGFPGQSGLRARPDRPRSAEVPRKSHRKGDQPR